MEQVNYLDWIKKYVDFDQICRSIILLAKTEGIEGSNEFTISNVSYTVEKIDYDAQRRREIRIYHKEKDDAEKDREMSINFGLSPIYNRKTNEIEKIRGRVNIVIRIDDNTSIMIAGILDNINSYDDVDNIKGSDLLNLDVYCRIMSGDRDNTYLEMFDLMTDTQIGNNIDRGDEDECHYVDEIKEGQTRVGRHLVSNEGDLVIDKAIEDVGKEESYLHDAEYIKKALEVRKKILNGTINEYVLGSGVLNAAIGCLYSTIRKKIGPAEEQKIKIIINK